jgi:hypothetical protein
MPNLFEAETAIIARLRELLPAEVDGFALRIGSMANLVGRTDLAGVTPGVFVMPGASDVNAGADGDPADADAITVEDQVWTVVALVRFVRDSTDFDESFITAGALMGLAYSALHGFTPGAGYRPMVFSGQQPPEVGERGIINFAIDFTVVRAFAPATA